MARANQPIEGPLRGKTRQSVSMAIAKRRAKLCRLAIANGVHWRMFAPVNIAHNHDVMHASMSPTLHSQYNNNMIMFTMPM